ncbi:hypothetical protein WOC76_07770 [Methylocystis sp. IM3]|uniref:hypothetical protein n=1 Tax=unclassified Methylocystis TaxID=2625913 RepID=UPI0030FA9B83
MMPRGLTKDLRLVIANVTPSPICVLLMQPRRWPTRTEIGVVLIQNEYHNELMGKELTGKRANPGGVGSLRLHPYVQKAAPSGKRPRLRSLMI